MCDSMEENTYKEDYILFDKTAKKKKLNQVHLNPNNRMAVEN